MHKGVSDRGSLCPGGVGRPPQGWDKVNGGLNRPEDARIQRKQVSL